MKNFIKINRAHAAKKTKLLTLFCCLIGATTMFAYDATVGGLYYNLNTTDYTATVTYKQGMSLSYSVYNYNWNIQTANIPSSITVSGKTYSVTSIGQEAFRDCSKLTSITIPNSVTSIGEYAFRGCTSLTSVTIPNGFTSIGEYAFSGCSGLTSITIPNSVTSIGRYAFSNCSSLTSVTIPNSVTSIGEYAFRGCTSLTSVTIPNSVTSIRNYAFSGCSSLTSVTIPNSVTSIGEWAFYDCSSLTSITIPNSVTSIGISAFRGCSGITAITVYAETPPTAQYISAGNNSNGKPDLFYSSAFYGLAQSDITLYVPQQWIPLYKYDPEWRKFNIQGIDATGLSFTVTWKNYDGSVLETDENVAAGTIPAYNGATPVKPADEQYTYTFAGWSPSVTTITGETTYIATFSATFKANTYTIHVNQDCTSYMEEQQ